MARTKDSHGDYGGVREGAGSMSDCLISSLMSPSDLLPEISLRQMSLRAAPSLLAGDEGDGTEARPRRAGGALEGGGHLAGRSRTSRWKE
jgi:hypothetical protein